MFNELTALMCCCCGCQGSFYAPTVISGATTDMKIFREETFGPAIPLFKFGKDDEAVQLANNTEYGLAAYFWTKVRFLTYHWSMAWQTTSDLAQIQSVNSSMAYVGLNLHHACCCHARIQEPASGYVLTCTMGSVCCELES